MRYFLHLAYKGTSYYGWQVQHNIQPTVQQVLESAIHKITKEMKSLHGCGRTDTGVHAIQFFAHLDTDLVLDQDFIFQLNKVLPDSIAVYDIFPVDLHANAQHDAIWRTYLYCMHQDKQPFLSEISYEYGDKLYDFEAMKAVIPLIKGSLNFKMFCRQPASYKDHTCIIRSCKLTIGPSGRIIFSITSNRFLREMVRLIVARLCDVARGALSKEYFQLLLDGHHASPYKNSAFPQGLFLYKIEYPYLSIPSRSFF